MSSQLSLSRRQKQKQQQQQQQQQLKQQLSPLHTNHDGGGNNNSNTINKKKDWRILISSLFSQKDQQQRPRPKQQQQHQQRYYHNIYYFIGFILLPIILFGWNINTNRPDSTIIIEGGGGGIGVGRRQQQQRQGRLQGRGRGVYTTEHTPATTHNNNPNKFKDLYIRRWGFNTSKYSPFIFIQIDNAADDTIRPMIASSAINYTRNDWTLLDNDQSYYLFPPSTSTSTSISTSLTKNQQQQQRSSSNSRIGKFCNAAFPHQRPIHDIKNQNYYDHENGIWICTATTPIGKMIGCPIRYSTTTTTKNNNNNNNNCYCNPKSKLCDLIYVGNNFVGSEIHWLPTPYLQSWWDTIHNTKNNNDTNTNSNNIISTKISQQLELLYHSDIQDMNEQTTDCFVKSNTNNKDGNSIVDDTSIQQRIIPIRGTNEYNNISYCSKPFEQKGDKYGLKWLNQLQQQQQQYKQKSTTTTLLFKGEEEEDRDNKVQQQQKSSKNNNKNKYNNFINDWSYLYASIPVGRVIVLRDPFDWLITKFFWHLLNEWNPNLYCDDIDMGIKGTNGYTIQQQYNNTKQNNPFHDIFDYTSHKMKYIGGWISQYSLSYILHICGEDCYTRLVTSYNNNNNNNKNNENENEKEEENSNNKISIETLYNEIQLQAQHNLQTSFIVVGLYNETETFYDMINKRFSYINIPNNNNNMNTNTNNNNVGISSLSSLSSSSSSSNNNNNNNRNNNLNNNNNNNNNNKKTKEYKSKEYIRCYKKFTTNTTFQNELLYYSPEVRILKHLYDIAIQVNHFQQKELLLL